MYIYIYIYIYINEYIYIYIELSLFKTIKTLQNLDKNVFKSSS